MLQRSGYPITVLPARREGLSLYDYCVDREMIPSPRARWCTQWWKVVPIRAYQEAPAFDLMGIDAGEPRRAKYRERDGIVADYPLVRWGVNRAGCLEVIKRHGLPIPKKSGCFFCPYQRREQWVDLRENYPDLWCKATRLEQIVVEKQRKKGNAPYYLGSHPLPDIVQENQGSLFDGYRRPCQCGL